MDYILFCIIILLLFYYNFDMLYNTIHNLDNIILNKIYDIKLNLMNISKSKKIQVKFIKVYNDSIEFKKAYENDAAYDIFSYDAGSLNVNEKIKIDTGIKLEIPSDYYAIIYPKSGLSFNNHLKVEIGVIDSTYRGIIYVSLQNNGINKYNVSKHQKIAQIIFKKQENIELVECNTTLSSTERSENGFGSTGL